MLFLLRVHFFQLEAGAKTRNIMPVAPLIFVKGKYRGFALLRVERINEQARCGFYFLDGGFRFFG